MHKRKKIREKENQEKKGIERDAMGKQIGKRKREGTQTVCACVCPRMDAVQFSDNAHKSNGKSSPIRMVHRFLRVKMWPCSIQHNSDNQLAETRTDWSKFEILPCRTWIGAVGDTLVRRMQKPEVSHAFISMSLHASIQMLAQTHRSWDKLKKHKLLDII